MSERDSAAHPRRWWREFRWWLRCKLRGYPQEVYETISPHPAPPEAVERLRRSVLEGKWD